jgi:Sec-independent protein translocase protein TatA
VAHNHTDCADWMLLLLLVVVVLLLSPTRCQL